MNRARTLVFFSITPTAFLVATAAVFLFAAGSALANVNTHVVVEGATVGGERAALSGGEIRYAKPGAVSLTLSCAPERPGAVYSVMADWRADALTSATGSVTFDPPPAGRGRIYCTARSATGIWSADTACVSFVATGEPASRSAPAPDPVPAPREAGAGHSMTFVALLLAAAAAALSLVFWFGGRRYFRRGVPRGAVVVTPLAMVPPQGVEDGGKPVQVPSRWPAGAHDPRLRELEEELDYLRTRIQDLLVKTRDLKRMNWELREKCSFLEHTNEELRELHKRKEEVLATLIHDIKNPAGAIQALAEILQSYELSGQEQAKVIGDILAVSSKIIRLSQDMSEVMMAEVRSLPLSLSIASVKDVVDQAAALNQVVASRKGITISVLCPEKAVDAEIDEPRIEEVLDNLVSNAVKYSRPNSRVLVEVKATPSHVTIDVTDQGIGLSQADVDQAFQLGKTLSNKPTGGEGSTGMGLWIVRKIIEAHRGLVWVRSSPGKGSTFSIMIPTRQTRAAA